MGGKGVLSKRKTYVQGPFGVYLSIYKRLNEVQVSEAEAEGKGYIVQLYYI